MELSPQLYALALIGAFCLGLSKTGFPGLSMINVFILAEIFGAKASVGIVLPMLVLSDLIVYPLFRRFASWRQAFPLFLPALAGVLAGWQLLDRVDDATARKIIGLIILAMLTLQLARRYRPEFLSQLPDSPGFRWTSGLSIGVATTLANAAGPIYSVYALVHKLSKEDFLGIGARFFLVINIVKLPFNAELGILDAGSLRTDALLVPGLLAGIAVGRFAITRVPQKLFESLLVVFTVAAGIRLTFF